MNPEFSALAKVRTNDIARLHGQIEALAKFTDDDRMLGKLESVLLYLEAAESAMEYAANLSAAQLRVQDRQRDALIKQYQDSLAARGCAEVGNGTH